MATDREDVARRATAAFEHAAERLAERGVSNIELGRAMVAAGLSRWSRDAFGRELVDELAKLTAGLAAAADIDLSADEPDEPGAPTTAH